MVAMPSTQHILVVANETATGEQLDRAVRALARFGLRTVVTTVDAAAGPRQVAA